MTTVSLPIGTYYQHDGTADPVASGLSTPVTVYRNPSSGYVRECGWQTATGITIPAGYYLHSAAFSFSSSVVFPNAPSIDDEPFALTLSRDGAAITTHAAWEALELPGPDIAAPIFRTDGVNGHSYPLTSILKDLWGYGRGATSIIPALRLTIHNGPFRLLPGVSADLSNPVLSIRYEELPGWSLESQLGGASLNISNSTRAAKLVSALGADSGITARATATPAGEFGTATKSGVIVVARSDAVAGSASHVASYLKARAAGVLGSASLWYSRFLIPLQLKAGRVASDVGYMWIPVYLQLPATVDRDVPWEFFYADGTPIPHLIRNNREFQVRALVYMRPSVALTQNFYCRVG